jgi:hypothetical protein
MPKSKTRLMTAVLGALVALMLIPAGGSAATNFGSRLNHDPTETTCDSPGIEGPCTIVSYIHPSDPDGDPYAGGAPVDGVITKFRVRAYAVDEPGQITFRLGSFQTLPAQGADEAIATAVGTGPTITINPDEDAIETPITEVGGRLPVKKGQYLAIDTTKSIGAVYNAGGSPFTYVYAPPLVEGTGPRGSFLATTELLVAATIEPDADGDGFGDETQDGCPTQAVSQGACDTAKPAVTGFGVANGTITYTLNEAATVKFQLAKKLPGRKAGKKCVKKTKANAAKKKCSRLKNVGAKFDGTGKVGKNTVKLPNGKKLKPGKYKLTMTATDAAGNTTTASTNFTVKKKKKKKK